MDKTTYYLYRSPYTKGHLILAKIVNNVEGYEYLGGQWVKYDYVLRAQFEDIDFDKITEDEAKEIIEEINSK